MVDFHREHSSNTLTTTGRRRQRSSKRRLIAHRRDLLCILPVVLWYSLICCCLASASTFMSSWRTPFLARRNDTASTESSLLQKNNINETFVLNNSSQSSQQHNNNASSLWSLASIFHMNNKLKSEASIDESPSYYQAPSGRGGAMVKSARSPPKRFQWLESSLGAPIAARLLAADAAAAGKEVTTSTTKIHQDTAPRIQDVSMASAVELPNDTKRNRRGDPPSEPSLATFDKTGVEQNRYGDAVMVDELSDDELEEEEEEDDDISSSTEETGSESESELYDSETTSLMQESRDNKSSVESSVVVSSNTVPSRQNASPSNTAVVEKDAVSPFVSSGYWESIDKALTFGLVRSHPDWRVSRRLRRIRKLTARATGIHGLLSGKKTAVVPKDANDVTDIEEDEKMGALRRRIAAIARARENLARLAGVDKLSTADPSSQSDQDFDVVIQQDSEEDREERLRLLRVKEIDRRIAASQKLLQDLACEKDVLKRRHNPLWNYTEEEETVKAALQRETIYSIASPETVLPTSRLFSFPPQDLVDEYLDMLFASGRIVKLNHTDLWRNSEAYMDDEEDDDDDELSSPLDDDYSRKQQRKPTVGGSGSWILRNGLGEKIGEAAETAGYKAVCHSTMSVLARCISALHGVTVLNHTDIRLSMESIPHLPPLAAGGRTSNYAQDAIGGAMKRGARRRKSRSSDVDFLQRDAVVETLLSHCQISAPLLTLFPIAWQRALLGNIIILVAAVITDFFEGLEFQILGHRLAFSFKPITENDMLRHIGMVGVGFNRKRENPERFEAAVEATANDLAENLKFLDRWHERALGSGLLRQQIANLIARILLTLADDVLTGAKLDLWTAQAGGPRLLAGLEYRQ